MTRLPALFSLLASVSFASTATAQMQIVDGDGAALQAALNALAPSGGTLVLQGPGPFETDKGFVYTGRDPLKIYGNWRTLRAKAPVDVLSVPNGADIILSDLFITGPGNWSVENQGAGKGLFVAIPADAQRMTTITMTDVVVQNTADHGIHITDCTEPKTCESGAPASITARLTNVMVDQTGIGTYDADGLRIDERGEGSIFLFTLGTLFRNNGGDGVELDEDQNGMVFVRGGGDTFEGNGGYCDPVVFASALPNPPKARFAAGTVQRDAIPALSSPDNRCIEAEISPHSDGSVKSYDFDLDLEDGFDIDEAGKGSIDASLLQASATRNFDQGFDLDEDGDGNLNANLTFMAASANQDDGLKVTENGAGSLNAVLSSGWALDNDGKGFVFEEDGKGDAMITLVSPVVRNNAGTSVDADQSGAGSGTLTLVSPQMTDAPRTQGVEVATP